MTYTKPSIDRGQVVGQMAATPSECDMYGGYWIKAECVYKVAGG